MRFEDERYVRLYTRDTTTWLMLSWQARFVLMSLLRKVDRAGILDVGEDGVDGLATVIGVPRDIVDAGLPHLIRRGAIEERNGTYIMPRFLEAQECTKSDSQRKREQRERDREIAQSQPKLPVFKVSSHEIQDTVTIGHSVPPVTVPPVPNLTTPEVSAAKDPKQPLSPEPKPNLQTQPKADVIREIFDHWFAGWTSRISGNRKPDLNDKRRSLIRKRLEKFSPEDLNLASDALWASDWHIQNGFATFEQVFNSDDRVEKFLTRAEATSSSRLTIAPTTDPEELEKMRNAEVKTKGLPLLTQAEIDAIDAAALADLDNIDFDRQINEAYKQVEEQWK